MGLGAVCSRELSEFLQNAELLHSLYHSKGCCGEITLTLSSLLREDRDQCRFFLGEMLAWAAKREDMDGFRFLLGIALQWQEYFDLLLQTLGTDTESGRLSGSPA